MHCEVSHGHESHVLPQNGTAAAVHQLQSYQKVIPQCLHHEHYLQTHREDELIDPAVHRNSGHIVDVNVDVS